MRRTGGKGKEWKGQEEKEYNGEDRKWRKEVNRTGGKDMGQELIDYRGSGKEKIELGKKVEERRWRQMWIKKNKKLSVWVQSRETSRTFFKKVLFKRRHL